MLLSRHRNAGHNRNINIANRSFENVAQFKYLGTTGTTQNLVQGEIKRRLNSGNACYHSVQNFLSSRLLSKNRVLKRIFGPRRDEVTGECRKLHNAELHDLYFSPSKIRIFKLRRMK
jgi:hypothetical protein